MAPDCTVIWWNAEVSRGQEEARAYYKRMVKDPGRLITKYTTQAKLGSHARFVGSRAPMWLWRRGSMQDEFFPVIRGPFTLDSRWSALPPRSTTARWKICEPAPFPPTSSPTP